jgi:hypothetical protein
VITAAVVVAAVAAAVAATLAALAAALATLTLGVVAVSAATLGMDFSACQSLNSLSAYAFNSATRAGRSISVPSRRSWSLMIRIATGSFSHILLNTPI